MPELPEVETTRRGIAPHLLETPIREICVREPRLRWPIAADLAIKLEGYAFTHITRRGKYLLLQNTRGTLLIHLGMSGSLRLCASDEPLKKHDHVTMTLASGLQCRYHDPRRFGAMLWTEDDPHCHPLLKKLGPEPLADDFDGALLFAKSRQRQICVKAFIMNAQIVVGVGNIYACESLFLSGVNPQTAANKISRKTYDLLADNIKKVLAHAIAQGGTTLKDFVAGDGKPGYFQQQLSVYGRAGEACKQCEKTIVAQVLAGRNTFYCEGCQR